jgi:hypothetical protein
MLAVLLDAVRCIRKTRQSPAQEKQAAAATEWMLSNRREHPFCFQEVCQELDWNPNQIRHSLMEVSRSRLPWVSTL